MDKFRRVRGHWSWLRRTACFLKEHRDLNMQTNSRKFNAVGTLTIYAWFLVRLDCFFGLSSLALNASAHPVL